MSELTFSDLEQAGAVDEAERTFQMDEDAFRAFYEQTARPLWMYLARMTGGEGRLADDLFQETYYRFLRAKSAFDGDDHRRNYLFRIATNLVRDHRRRPREETTPRAEPGAASTADTAAAERVTRRIDVTRAMERLNQRERTLQWLAYAQGFSHAEMAASLGLKTGSLKTLLFRARQRLLRLLSDGGSR